MMVEFTYAIAPAWISNATRDAELRRCIDTLSDSVMEAYELEHTLFHTNDWAEARLALYAACLQVAEEGLATGSETNWLKVDGMSWRAVITGGPCSGEPPTDIFDTINMVHCVEEVFELLKRWSTEDEAAAAPHYG